MCRTCTLSGEHNNIDFPVLKYCFLIQVFENAINLKNDISKSILCTKNMVTEIRWFTSE